MFARSSCRASRDWSAVNYFIWSAGAEACAISVGFDGSRRALPRAPVECGQIIVEM